MTDAPHFETRLTAWSLLLKKGKLVRLIGLTKGSVSAKLHTVAAGDVYSLSLFMTVRHISRATALINIPLSANG